MLIKVFDERSAAQRRIEDRFEFCRTMSCRVRIKHPLTTCAGNSCKLRLRKLQRRDHVIRVTRDDDLNVWLEERVEARPLVRHDRGTTGGRFEEPTGRAVAHSRH